VGLRLPKWCRTLATLNSAWLQGLAPRRKRVGLLSKAETVTVAAIEAAVPTLVEAREIIADFHLMIRRKTEEALTPWIERARASIVASFASGVTKDKGAVRAAIALPWSNGQTEAQIMRLKLVRRQMYGRGKIDLLQVRLIGAE
jgi:transposase